MPNVNKVIYGSDILIDITNSTVDAAHLAVGYTAYDKSGTLINGEHIIDPRYTPTTPASTARKNNKIIVNNETIIDISDATVDSRWLVEGYKAYNKKGALITGAMPDVIEGGDVFVSGLGFNVGQVIFIGEKIINDTNTTVQYSDGQLYTLSPGEEISFNKNKIISSDIISILGIDIPIFSVNDAYELVVSDNLTYSAAVGVIGQRSNKLYVSGGAMVTVQLKNPDHYLVSFTENGVSKTWYTDSYSTGFVESNVQLIAVTTDHLHQMAYSEGTPSTCIEAGTASYYYCSLCNLLFSDELGINEISIDDLTLPLADHTWGDWIVIERATKLKKGTRHRQCQVCGEWSPTYTYAYGK